MWRLDVRVRASDAHGIHRTKELWFYHFDEIQDRIRDALNAAGVTAHQTRPR